MGTLAVPAGRPAATFFLKLLLIWRALLIRAVGAMSNLGDNLGLRFASPQVAATPRPLAQMAPPAINLRTCCAASRRKASDGPLALQNAATIQREIALVAVGISLAGGFE